MYSCLGIRRRAASSNSCRGKPNEMQLKRVRWSEALKGTRSCPETKYCASTCTEDQEHLK